MLRMNSATKLKQTFIFATLLSCSATAWSSGFYVGLGAGPEAIKFNKNTITDEPGNIYVADNANLSGTGMFGSIFGGYGWAQASYYLAAEANFDVNNAKNKASNDEVLHGTLTSSYLRLRHAFGLSVLPGYLITETTLLYARLGYALAYFNISSTDVDIANMNKNLAGINFGLGFNQTLNKQFSMRMEYRQAQYQSTSQALVTGPIRKITDFAPTTGQVEFALIYNIS